jgi:hypothetical protein
MRRILGFLLRKTPRLSHFCSIQEYSLLHQYFPCMFPITWDVNLWEETAAGPLPPPPQLFFHSASSNIHMDDACNLFLYTCLSYTSEHATPIFPSQLFKQIKPPYRLPPEFHSSIHRYFSQCNLLTYRVLPEKLKLPKLLKKFPAFYGNRRFITAFTRARHLSLS